MVNFEDLDKEKIAEAERISRDMANTLGKDGSIHSEPFVRNNKIALADVMTRTPSVDGGLLPPNYDDLPSVAAVGTRYTQVRLYSYLPSGLDGATSVQTFISVFAEPDSNSASDIEAVRLYPLISPKYSQGKANAAHEDPNFRGFELALYPAKSNGGIGNALIADTSKPISPVADPGAGPPNELVPGVGTDGSWAVDYDAGMVRFSRAPLNGSNGIMNPNNVYGNISGIETSDAYGAITMFATFYHYTGDFGNPENISFVTVGDGYVSSGIFTGQSHDTVQAAINSLPANGGTIFIKEGTYTFLSAVRIPQSVSVVGLKGAKIRRPTSEAAFIVQDGYVTIDGVEIQPHGADSVVSGGTGAIELGSNQPGEIIKYVTIKNSIIYGEDDAPAIAFSSAFNCTYIGLKISGNLFEAEPESLSATFIGEKDAGGIVTVTDLVISDNNFSGGTGSKVANLITSATVIQKANIHDNFWEGRITLASYDNINFTSNNVASGSPNIKSYGNGAIYFAVGTAGNAAYSYNGTTWNPAINIFNSIDIYAIGYNNKDKWVIVGPGASSYSYDGVNWIGPSSIDISFPYAIAHNNKDLWVAAGDTGKVIYSSDGITWSNSINALTSSDILTVAHNGKDLWIVAGVTGKLAYSYNGITWNGPVSVFGGNHIYAVAYNNSNLWVAVGQGGNAAYSSDGINWSTPVVITIGTDLFAVAHNGKDLWVAGGASGITHSSDGINWSPLVNVFGTSVRTVAYNGKDLWVAGADNGNVAYSSDGINWSSTTNILGYVTAIAIVGGSNAGIAAHGSSYNGTGVQGFGHGNYGIGVEGFGGDGYGAGVKGVGGTLGGTGVAGFGAGPDGYGVFGIGGRNGVGVVGKGVGYGTGMMGIGGALGGQGIKAIAGGQLVIAGTGTGKIFTSNDGSSWVERSTQLGTDSIADIAHNGKDLWIAVSAATAGLISISPDGVNWTSQSTGLTSGALCIAHNQKDLWVIAAVDGSLATSPNGFDWTIYPGNNQIYNLVYEKNLWIATAASGTIYTSSNGTSWTGRSAGFVSTDIVNDAAFNGKDLWVAVGGQTNVTGKIATSPDGITWTQQTSGFGTTNILGVAHNGKDLWVAVGGFPGVSSKIATSPDGITWTQQTHSFGLANVATIIYTGKIWIASGADGATTKIATSTDGVTWTLQTNPFGTNFIGVMKSLKGSNAGLVAYGSPYNGTAIQAFGQGNIGTGIEAFGGDGYAVGIKGVSGVLGGAGVQGHGIGGGLGGEFFGGNVASGIFAKSGMGGAPGIQSVGDGYFVVAVGGSSNGQIGTSIDGITWTQRVHGFGSNLVRGVAHDGKGTWVAVGQNGTLALSTDGINWVTTTGPFGATFMNNVAYSKGLWVAVGNGGVIYTSTNAINWNLRASGTTNDIFGIAHNGKDLWIVGTGSRLAISSDGIAWKLLPPTDGANSVGYCIAHNGRDLWAAGGINGVISTSIDGINWVRQTTPFGLSFVLGIAHNKKDLWVAVGNGGVVATSPDGITWTQQDSGFGGSTIGSVAYNGVWIIGGSQGKLSVSTDGVEWTLQSTFFDSINNLNVATYSNAGLVARGSLYNGTGVQGFGGGNFGVGVEGFGGDGYAIGIRGVGGTSGGAGVQGHGVGALAKGGHFYGSSGGAGLVASSIGTMYVATGAGGKLAISLNGFDWSQVTNSFGASDILDVAYDGRGTWVAVGVSGKIAISNDGITWMAPAYDASALLGGVNLNCVIYDTTRGLWAIFGNGTVIYSNDGNNWRSAVGSFNPGGNFQNPTFQTAEIFAVAVDNNGLWVAVCGLGRIFYSSDAGVTWYFSDSTALFGGTANIVDVVHNGRNSWVAVSSNGMMANSEDGYSWTQNISGTNAFDGSQILAIAYNGKDTMVAVGSGGKIATSPSGFFWTLQTSGFGSETINAIYYNGYDRWFAGSTNGQLSSSPDGANWTQQTSSFGASTIYSIKSIYGSNSGIIGHGSQYNGTGVQGFGHGNLGVGVEGFGGDGYAPGMRGYGGAAGGTGLIGYGGGYDGYGVVGIGGTGVGVDPFTFGTTFDTSAGVGVLGVGGVGVMGLGRAFGDGMYAKAGDGYGVGLRAVGGNAGGPGVAASSSGSIAVLVGTSGGGLTPFSYSQDGGVTWRYGASIFSSGVTTVTTVATDGKGTWLAGLSNSGGALSSLYYSTDGLSWVPYTGFGFNDSTAWSGVTKIVYANNKWVVAGTGTAQQSTFTNQIAASYDLVNWSFGAPVVTLTDFTFNGKDTFIAVGSNAVGATGGRRYISNDGINWNLLPFLASDTTFFPASPQCIAYGNGIWAVGGSGTTAICTSSDNGATWTVRANLASIIIKEIEYNGKDQWVAVGNDSGTFDGKIYSSQDAITWTLRVSDPGIGSTNSTLAYVNDHWVVIIGTGGISRVSISYNGENWTPLVFTNSSENPAQIAVGMGNNAGVIGRGSPYYGTGVQGYGGGSFGTGVEGFGGDGYSIGVVGVSGSLGGTGVRGLGSGLVGYGGEFIGSGFRSGIDAAGGWAGAAGITSITKGQLMIAVGDSAKLAYAPDGYNWNLRTNTLTGNALNIAHDGRGTWVATGTNGEIIYSVDDGITWTLSTNDPFAVTDSIYALCHDRVGLWIAAGTGGRLATSRDGKVWSGSAAGSFLGFQGLSLFNSDIRTIASNGVGMWVAAGANGQLGTSFDGVSWKPRVSGFGQDTILSVAYNNKDLWMAVGNNGKIATSPDGITWTLTTLAGGVIHWNTVAHNGKDLWVIGGAFGAIWTSPDGITWTAQYNGFENNTIRSIAFNGKDLWVAVGDLGMIAVSNDATSWNILPDSQGGFGFGAFGSSTINNIAFKVGSNAGIIATGSPDGTGVQGIASGAYGIGVEGFGGDGYGPGIKGIGSALGGPGILGIGGGSGQIASNARGGEFYGNNVGAGLFAKAGWGGAAAGIEAEGTNTIYVLINGDIAASSDGYTWYDRPIALGNIGCVAYNGKDFWVAGANNGNIATSPDGINWTERTTALTSYGPAVSFFDIAYDGKGLWIATSSSGTINTSPDGITWTPQHNIIDSVGVNGQGIAHNQRDMWIIGCAGGQIISSYDGFAWKRTQLSTGSGADFECVAYGGGQWIVSGGFGANPPEIYTSPDGINWIRRTNSATLASNAIAYNGKDLWIIVCNGGQLITSPDGAVWTSQSTSIGVDISAVSFDGKDTWYIGTDNGIVATSTDGVNWTQIPTGLLGNTVNQILIAHTSNAGIVAEGSAYTGTGVIGYGGGNAGVGVLGVGGDGYATGVKGISGTYGGAAILGVGAGGLATGGEFYGSGLGMGIAAVGGQQGAAGIEGIAKGQYIIAIADSTKMASSPDGYIWTRQPNPFTGTGRNIAHNGRDTWVATGSFGEIAYSKDDGVTWKLATNTPFVVGADAIFGIDHDRIGLWVAGGTGGRYATSRDGITWSGQGTILGGNDIRTIGHNGKDLWVAGGAAGNLATSPDGITWTSRTSGFGADAINSVAYNGKDVWMIVGDNGKTATSSDGVTWIFLDIGVPSWNGVAHNGRDLWVVVGASGAIWSSPDGINWTTQMNSTTVPTLTLQAVAHNGKDLWIAAGALGNIQVSTDAVHWYSSPNTGLGAGEGVFGNDSVFGLAFKRNSNAGVIGFGGANGTGVQGIGGGYLGIGVEGFGDGDGYGIGVRGVGGFAGGPGVMGLGGGSDGYGIIGVGTLSYGVVASSAVTSPRRSSLRLVPQDTDPTLAAGGDIYAHTSNKIRAYDGFTWNRLVSQSNVTLTASTGVGGTATETSFDRTYTIPPNVLTVGSTVRVMASGIATATVAADTLTITLRFGNATTGAPPTGTVVVQSFAQDPANNDAWNIDSWITIRTAGAGGTFIGGGFAGVSPAGLRNTAMTTTASIDTTATQLVVISATWNTANANSVRLDQLIVDVQ